MRAKSKAYDAKAISYHYDVSNDFYQLFLDPLMVYTCAYYRDPDGKLEQAQMDKLDLVCRKLRLQAGETMLDIGCGWGALSIWAAQHYGVKAHGVTLSRQQAAWAADRSQDWEVLTFSQFGLHATLRVKIMQALYYTAGKDQLLSIGLVDDTVGQRPTQMFCATRLDWDARTILSLYAARWSIEVTFENAKG